MAKNAPQNEPESPERKLDSVLDRLTSYYPRAIDPGLDRTLRLLADLGNPHLALPPVFHVAGTNGKGSVVATLRSVLEAAGQKCHVMTSPHLVRFNERLVVAGQEISTTDLVSLLEEVEDVNAGKPTTSFELITAAGFLAFARTKADFTLLETGMGGRLDATNVIPNPLATTITVISHDHMQFLGTELSAIAGEKAGIMKPGCPCVIAPQTVEAQQNGVLEVFRDKAKELGCPLYEYGRDWNIEPKGDGFLLQQKNGANIALPRPNLLGAHQVRNAATAVMTLLAAQNRLPGNALEHETLVHGVQHIRWPGRLQRLLRGPLPNLLPAGWELWCDGGHNDTGGEVLGEQAKVWKQEDGKPLHLVLGMLTTKDPRAFLAPLTPHAASLHAVAIPGNAQCFTASDLAQIAAAVPSPSATTAIQDIVQQNQTIGRILITGSLYLTGYILSENS
jgi:dihydrofolate synthase/folylpolyglutamate synthase